MAEFTPRPEREIEILCLDPRYSTTRRVVCLGNRTASAAVDANSVARKGGGLRTRGFGKEPSYSDGRDGNPLITVITVVWNGERYLEDAIRSVLDQNYDNVEYILIDGASTDGTLSIVERYDHALDYWISEPDAGIYDAMNKGLAVATGDVVGILNADDTYNRGVLSQVARTLTETGAAYAYGAVMRRDAAGRPISLTRPLPVEQFARKCVSQGPFPHPSLFVRRHVFREIGGFDPVFKVAADRDFIARMILGGYRGAGLEGTVACMRSGGVSDRMQRFSETRRVARKHGVSVFRAFAAYTATTLKLLLARHLPRPIIRALLKLRGSRHQWLEGDSR